MALDSESQQEDAKTLSQMRRSRLDPTKRHVFLCPTSLSKNFDSLPRQVTDTALLVFRCSRDAVFCEPARVRVGRVATKIQTGTASRRRPDTGSLASAAAKSMAAGLYRSEHSPEFMSWVSSKEEEGCVFWYKPHRDLAKLSRFFEEKIDPSKERRYKKLLLDPPWWRTRFKPAKARFIGSPKLVLLALGSDTSRRLADGDGLGGGHSTSTSSFDWSLSSLDAELPQSQDIDMAALQELIYQSNPSLEPVAKWPYAPSMRFLPKVPKAESYTAQARLVKGYIDDSIFRAAPSGGRARFEIWPSSARDRFDNLHSLWDVEEATCCRRVCYDNEQGCGRALLPLVPFSAR